jgi:hypothetical protein
MVLSLVTAVEGINPCVELVAREWLWDARATPSVIMLQVPSDARCGTPKLLSDAKLTIDRLEASLASSWL